MSFVLKNCGIFSDGYDFSGVHNEISLDFSKEVLDKTTFSATRTSREKTVGLTDCKISGVGLVNLNATGSDKIFYDQLNITQKLTTILPENQDEGSIAYFTQSLRSTYKPGARVGQLLAFNYDSESYDDIVNGTNILRNTALIASGNGTAYNLGSVSSSQYLYAGLHVIGISGTAVPTISVKIQSDDLGTFASPTDRISFSAVTAIGSQWATPVVGPITDPWWRVNYTISGTNPIFSILVVLGIQLP